eukprot:1709423-Pleurochrysis_carterae.AAC.1
MLTFACYLRCTYTRLSAVDYGTSFTGRHAVPALCIKTSSADLAILHSTRFMIEAFVRHLCVYSPVIFTEPAFDVEALQALAEALQHNTTLTDLKLDWWNSNGEFEDGEMC